MEQQRAQDRDRIWVEWMRAANAGDEIAYRRLLEALAPLLRQVVRRGFAHSGFGNCDVEDVVQETLLAIHLKRQTWDEDEALTPWVMAIARHKLIDSYAAAAVISNCRLMISLMSYLPRFRQKPYRAETRSGFSQSLPADSAMRCAPYRSKGSA